MCIKTGKSFDRKPGKPTLSGAKEDTGRGLQVAWTLRWRGQSGSAETGGEWDKRGGRE